ncbi:MAG: hypothetical protein RL323_587 [Pseudomonadota bacterium]
MAPTAVTREDTVWLGASEPKPGIRVECSAWGASWLRCEVRLPDGSLRQVLLPPSYPQVGPHQPRSYMGSTLGRYANRIAHGRFSQKHQTWALKREPGQPHQLHGGPHGWDTRRWEQTSLTGSSVAYTLESPDGDQGYPGHASVQTQYQLLDDWSLELSWRVTVDQSCPVCVSNHAYFNLDPRNEQGGCTDVRQHTLQLNAQRFAPVDVGLIPLGPLAPTAHTSFDFRTPRKLLTHWLQDEQQRHGAGYDHAFLLDKPSLDQPAAWLGSADGRLTLSLFSTQPALQLYAGQYLAGLPAPNGQTYLACQGLALEPQWLPDSPNHPEWPQPTVWLEPGQAWEHRAIYRFHTTD